MNITTIWVYFLAIALLPIFNSCSDRRSINYKNSVNYPGQFTSLEMAQQEKLKSRILTSTKDIMESQLALKKLGYKINITGELDPPTISALRAFQNTQGLMPDGKISQHTYNLLQASAANSTQQEYAE